MENESIARKFLAHFINATPTAEAATYVRLGKDLEEYRKEASADVSTSKNICGETRTKIKGYEKTASVEPYYAEQGDPLFTWLKKLDDEDAVLDACNTDIVDVYLWEAQAANGYPAMKERVVVEIKSFGGDTEGLAIPFDVHYTGAKTPGYFNPATKAFTEEAGGGS